MSSQPTEQRDSAKCATVLATPFGDAEQPVSSPPLTPAPQPPSGVVYTGIGDTDGRYEPHGMLGEGGMGEVRLCQDLRIGREVAMKVVRPGRGSRSDVRARFLHEARVQGQLEHPSIVPVYDLATDETGALFFTMKRVRGVTFEQILEGLRAPAPRDGPPTGGGPPSSLGAPASGSPYSRHKLLTALASVCLTVHFAHTHGVIHRDLKPSNIMLGDFGELYVLDWGLAKQMGAPPISRGPVSFPPSSTGANGSAGNTTQGAILGTPGYMAPEQFRGDVEALDARTDIYALGAILFEILTRTPLHDQDTATAIKQSTLRGADARPSVRVPDLDVEPELEAICVAATALDPGARFRTAREMNEALERFLEGDRDLSLRRAMAKKHAALASEAADRALTGIRDESPIARAAALSEVGRALALDPLNPRAMKTLVRLLTEPPDDVPAEVRDAENESARTAQHTSARGAAWAYATWFLFVPFMAWAGIRSAPFFVFQLVLFGLAAAVSAYYAKRPLADGRTPYPMLVLSMLAVGSIGVTLSPFILVSGIAAVCAMAFLIQPDRARRAPIVVAGCLTVLLPFLLEWVGLVSPSYVVEGGRLVLLPRVVSISAATPAILAIANLALIPTIALWVLRFRRTLSAAERKQHLLAWQLGQLVPTDARTTQPD